MTKHYWISIACSLALFAAHAQKIEVTRVELKGAQVVLHYILTDSLPGRQYGIYLYSSLDNFISPLSEVMGDVGNEVKPGVRQAIWNAKNELGTNFDGSVAIEIRARIFIPFLQFDAISSIKKGKNTDLTWRGGSPQSTLNFEIWRKNERLDVVPNILNAGRTTLVLPAGLKPGKGYYFKIVDSKNKDQSITTQPFTIRPRYPLALKVLPVAAIGAAILLLQGDDNVEKEITDPPGVPPRG